MINIWDQDNLRWFITCPTDEFEQWMDESEQAGIDYMFELVDRNRGFATMVKIEAADDVRDLDLARTVIDKICK
jgi:hypothetical protein